MASLAFQKVLFTLEAKEPLILPSYKGATLRGGFGHAFKRVVCALREKNCRDCLLKEKCIYSYVFETPPPSDTRIMRKYSAAPHPFVIEPPSETKRGFVPGNEITFNLILIGKAIGYLPYFIYAFDELGEIGIGKGKGKFELRSVECDGKTIYDSESKTLKHIKTASLSFYNAGSGEGCSDIKLNFLTPTRILYNGSLTLDLQFHILIRQLLRRLSLLSYFHCGGNPSEIDFKGMIEKAKEVKVKKSNLCWYDWERYSARQDTRMKMGGFLGEITFEGDIQAFLPLVKAGEVLHVGKGTTFGLGKYEII